ncbi:MAG: cytochrome oxidase subunit III [SAR202 cluster bacterium]|nr:cytochrome oxidase subunit III [SAR202 cluster bacterium]
MAAAHAEEHPATTTGLDHRKLLIWAFLASDCMFFGALIATYLVYYGKSLVGPYPQDVFDIPVTSVSTFVLLMSSMSMVLSYSALRRGNIKAFRIWLLSTCILGATFIGFQVFEFNDFVQHGLTPRTNLFGSTFFTLTGTHGAHVTLGIIWLLSMFFYSFKKGGITPAKHLELDIAALYWHFVDIVWIVIFTVVYLFGVFEGF